MTSAGVVRVVSPKSDIFSTNLPSIRQLYDRSFPCTITSELCKYAIPWNETIIYQFIPNTQNFVIYNASNFYLSAIFDFRIMVSQWDSRKKAGDAVPVKIQEKGEKRYKYSRLVSTECSKKILIYLYRFQNPFFLSHWDIM